MYEGELEIVNKSKMIIPLVTMKGELKLVIPLYFSIAKLKKCTYHRYSRTKILPVLLLRAPSPKPQRKTPQIPLVNQFHPDQPETPFLMARKIKPCSFSL